MVIKHYTVFLFITILCFLLIRASLASETGSIFVTTQPVGAEVFLNDSKVGYTPLPLSGIPEGKHNLKVSLKNYKETTREIKVIKGETLTVNIILEEKEETLLGTVHIKSTPPNSTVSFDKVNMGKTPTTLEQVAEGSHDIEITFKGYESYKKTIEVTGGEEITIDANLTPSITSPTLSPSKEPVQSQEKLLTIRTRPPDAEIYIDDKFEGNSPLIDIALKEGKHNVKILKSGFETIVKEIEINSEKKEEITINLTETKGIINRNNHILYLAGIIIIIIIIAAIIGIKKLFIDSKSGDASGPGIDGSYNPESKISEDSFFTAYKGKHKSTGQRAIIKRPLPYLSQDPVFAKFFQENIKDARSLDHPNIIKVYECGSEKKSLYIVTEYFKAKTLEEIVSSGKKLDLKKIVDVIFQASLALSYAKGKNIIHGDLKLSNILINKDGQIKINDFCIYKDLYSHSINSIGVYKGEINYMAPEKLEKKPVDFRADLFSLGIIFYRLLTGELPFEGETPHLLLESQYYKEIRSITPPGLNLPTKIKEIIGDLIQIDPYQRGKSTEQIMKLLKGIKGNL